MTVFVMHIPVGTVMSAKMLSVPSDRGGKLAGLKTYRQLPGFYSRQLFVRHPFPFFHIARFPVLCGEVTHLAG